MSNAALPQGTQGAQRFYLILSITYDAPLNLNCLKRCGHVEILNMPVFLFPIAMLHIDDKNPIQCA